MVGNSVTELQAARDKINQSSKVDLIINLRLNIRLMYRLHTQTKNVI